MEALLVTRIDAAKALAISVDTIDRLRCEGKLRSVTIGSRVYFALEELQAFVRTEGKLC